MVFARVSSLVLELFSCVLFLGLRLWCGFVDLLVRVFVIGFDMVLWWDLLICCVVYRLRSSGCGWLRVVVSGLSRGCFC